MANEDARYTEWLRSLPCCACGSTTGVQVHHKTGAGMGLRAHDRDGMPMCFKCHSDLHCLTGRFATYCKADLRGWQAEQVEVLRGAYAPAGGTEEEWDGQSYF